MIKSKKLFVLKSYLYSKIDWMENLFVLQNYLDSKIDWMEKLFIPKKLLGFKNLLDGKTTLY